MTCEATSASADCATAWTLPREPGRRGSGGRNHCRQSNRRAGNPAHHADVSHRGRPHLCHENEIRTRRAAACDFARIRQRSVNRGEERRSDATARSSSSTPRSASSKLYGSQRGDPFCPEDEEIEWGRVLCQWGPALLPFGRKSAARCGLRTVIEGRSDPLRARGFGQPAEDRHRTQGRPASADHSRRPPPARSSTSIHLPDRSTLEGRKPGDHRGSVFAKKPPRGDRNAGLVVSAPRSLELFEARKPKESGDHRRDRRRGGACRREEAQANGSSSSRATIRPRSSMSFRTAKQLLVHANDRVRAGGRFGSADRSFRTIFPRQRGPRPCSSIFCTKSRTSTGRSASRSTTTHRDRPSRRCCAN